MKKSKQQKLIPKRQHTNYFNPQEIPHFFPSNLESLYYQNKAVRQKLRFKDRKHSSYYRIPTSITSGLKTYVSPFLQAMLLFYKAVSWHMHLYVFAGMDDSFIWDPEIVLNIEREEQPLLHVSISLFLPSAHMYAKRGYFFPQSKMTKFKH